MHDYDNNTKLDGLELLKSMTHFHDEHEGEHENEEKKEEGMQLIHCFSSHYESTRTLSMSFLSDKQ